MQWYSLSTVASPPHILPRNTVSGAVLRAVIVQFVSSDKAILGLAVVQQILLVENCTIRARIPLLASGVSVFISLAGLLRCASVVNLL